MNFKKRIIPMIVGTLSAILLTSTASAHPYDYWNGKYIGKNGTNILLRICESAQTSLLTKDEVYEVCFDWNGISSNVNVKMAWAVPGMPSLKDEMLVMGEFDSVGHYGRICPYDSNGNIIDYEGGENQNWSDACVYMNINPDAFSGAIDTTVAAKKTFTHEVGHLLKLCHPSKNSSLSEHTINGYPYAVMNQGLPNAYQTSSVITYHDKDCLKAKWGV